MFGPNEILVIDLKVEIVELFGNMGNVHIFSPNCLDVKVLLAGHEFGHFGDLQKSQRFLGYVGAVTDTVVIRSGASLSLVFRGKRERERRSFTRFGVNPNLATVALDDALTER